MYEPHFERNVGSRGKLGRRYNHWDLPIRSQAPKSHDMEKVQRLDGSGRKLKVKSSPTREGVWVVIILHSFVLRHGNVRPQKTMILRGNAQMSWYIAERNCRDDL